jgi:hypothetical protein
LREHLLNVQPIYTQNSDHCNRSLILAMGVHLHPFSRLHHCSIMMFHGSRVEDVFQIKVPSEMFRLILSNGTCIELPACIRDSSRKDYVMCDLCDLSVLKGSGGRLRQHRNNTKCVQRRRTSEKRKTEVAEREKAAGMLETLRGSLRTINENGIDITSHIRVPDHSLKHVI